jgi:GMP synthase (glutamine-hydrolysing)
MSRDEIKIAVFHIRRDADIANHEFNVVAETAKLNPDQFDRFNVFHGEKIELGELTAYSGIIIGGSGGCSVLDDHDFIEYLHEVARYAKEQNIPFLGLCYGFQIAVQALGGTMIHDKESMEVGAMPAVIHEDGLDYPLFKGLPQQLLVPCGREDRATILPPGSVSYVKTDKCPFHHLTFPGTKFHGVQFHPELWRKDDNIVRIEFYQQKYKLTEDQFDEKVQNFQDAPRSAKVLENWVDHVVLS